jgi:hypothetical protein
MGYDSASAIATPAGKKAASRSHAKSAPPQSAPAKAH